MEAKEKVVKERDRGDGHSFALLIVGLLLVFKGR
jgi:hypothetical protein